MAASPQLALHGLRASLASAPRHGRWGACADGALVVSVASATDLYVWSAANAAAGAEIVDVVAGGQPMAGAPLPAEICDVVCFTVPALASRAAFACICVGFDTGELRVLRADGAFLFATRAHGSRIVRLRTHASAEGGGQLTVLHEGAVVCVDGTSLHGVLHTCAREAAAAAASWGPASTMPAVELRRWACPHSAGEHGLGGLVDVACCGAPPASPFEGVSSLDDSLCLVLAGAGGSACLLTALAPDDSAAAFSAASLALNAASALFSAARGLLWGGGGREAGGAAAAEEEQRRQREAALIAPPAVALAPVRALADPPRGVRALALSARGRWAAAADSLGRVLLLEVPSLIVRRMWRGYREAQCAWVDAAGADGAGRAELLVIYAPRRGRLEAWRPLPGAPRVGACAVGSDGHLLGGAHGLGRGVGAAPCCIFLSADGVLSEVRVAPLQPAHSHPPTQPQTE